MGLLLSLPILTCFYATFLYRVHAVFALDMLRQNNIDNHAYLQYVESNLRSGTNMLFVIVK